MPSDIVDGLFGALATTEFPVPAQHAVVARGRQRRRNARLGAAAVGLAVAVAAGSVAATIQHATAGRHAPATPGSHLAQLRELPPAGSGSLLLGFTARGEWAMARTDSTLRPVRLRSLPAASGTSVVASDPAGGWVVSYPAGPPSSAPGQPSTGPPGTASAQQPFGLATISTSGVVRPFGPRFYAARSVLTSMAVRPDGTAVAVGISLAAAGRAGPARIELIPIAGASGRIRVWSLPASATEVRSLSWAPDGTDLTYIPGTDLTGGGFAGTGAVTFNTAQPGSRAPATSAWPPFTKARGTCHLDGAAWVGSRYLALEQCGLGEVLVPVRVRTGAHSGPTVTVQGSGCPPPLFSSGADGSRLLISYCELQMETGGQFQRVPGPLVQAAFAGGG
jgi:hypothetical protein